MLSQNGEVCEVSFPLCDPSLCTGCTACAHSCPVSAISMKEDAEGFDYRKNICFIESIDQNDYIGNNKKLFKEWYNFAGLGSSLSATYNQSKFIENLSTNIKKITLMRNPSNIYHA